MAVALRAVAAILTVLLHLLMLFALVHVRARLVEPPQPPTGQRDMSADKLYGAGERTIRVDIVSGLSTRGLACAGSSYIGVGVTADPGSERIILVGDDTPASRAGLRHGDIVLNPGVWRDAHREGSVLHLVILRDGMMIAVAVQVGKICIG